MKLVKEYVEQLRAAKDKKGEAMMLHKLSTMSPFPDIALNTAQSALALAQKVGDATLTRAIKRTLSDLWVAKGRPEKAPTRKEALALLNDMARAIDKKDAAAFSSANKKLADYWNVLQQTDFEATVYKAVANSPEDSIQFMSENGADMGEEKKQEVTSDPDFIPVPTPYIYMAFRVGGLGYGPRYRVQVPGYKIVKPQVEAVAVLKLSDASDDWERELGYNPSMLDGSVQGGMVMSLA